MNIKVIPFYGRHYKRRKYPPLTSKMIVALLAVCEKQHAKKIFGPVDVKRSLTGLITRGLIVRKTVRVDGKELLQWQATFRAVELLLRLGLKIDC